MINKLRWPLKVPTLLLGTLHYLKFNYALSVPNYEVLIKYIISSEVENLNLPMGTLFNPALAG